MLLCTRRFKQALACLFFFGLSLQVVASPSSFYPEVLLKMDDLFSHHVLIAEKSTHQLHLFKNENGLPKLIQSFDVATGKFAGNKSTQGDHRTPEGVYRFTDFLKHAQLLETHGKEVGAIYGVGAFVMDYPNPIDRIMGKTGGGIWLHSTNDESRIDLGLDSRGCIVSTNKDLIELSQYLELNRSSVIVVQDLRFLTQETWNKQRQQIEGVLGQWLDSWRELDIKSYLTFYNQEMFWDPVRSDFKAFSTHKRAVFQQPKKPSIEISDISILASGLDASDYLKVTFLQHYKSANLNDLGKKTLYLKRDKSYQWKIVSELWSKHGVPEELEQKLLEGQTQPELGQHGLAFRPTMRFFETRDPAQILQIEFRKREGRP
jgi:murein L,D-transpeptidase YafK